MTPLEILLAIARISFQAGDLSTARIAAVDAANYIHPRKIANQDGESIPVDLMPDPAPAPDEEAPEFPIF